MLERIPGVRQLQRRSAEIETVGFGVTFVTTAAISNHHEKVSKATSDFPLSYGALVDAASNVGFSEPSVYFILLAFTGVLTAHGAVRWANKQRDSRGF